MYLQRGFKRGCSLLGMASNRPSSLWRWSSTCGKSKSGCSKEKKEQAETGFDWGCVPTWKRAAVNTSWCLLGCSMGEFATLGAFQMFGVTEVSTMTVVLPVVNGLITSVALETAILHRKSAMPLDQAFKTAMGMSFISMCAMELAMETTDFCLTGGLQLQLWAIPPMLASGFLTPLPYNYWRLKKYNKACH